MNGTRQVPNRDSVAEIAKWAYKHYKATQNVSGSSSTYFPLMATEAKQDLIIERLVAETFTTIPGNSVGMTYYGGVVAGNPSGALTNIQSAIYSDSGGAVFTQTFTYDINNNILTIVVS